MPSRFLRVKSATVAGLAVLSIGGVAAAATGLAPAAAERVPTQARSMPDAPGKGAAHGRGQAVTATLPDAPAAASDSKGSSSDKAVDHAAGPDASGPARQGLCQAWLAGQGDVHGQRADAPAFRALAAAGGADQVAAYCKADSDASAKQEQRPIAPPTTTGQRENPGQGHGKGGPPTTT